jgi:hypothetical protein
MVRQVYGEWKTFFVTKWWVSKKGRSVIEKMKMKKNSKKYNNYNSYPFSV